MLTLFQIASPYFCAGGEIKDKKVITAAPIISYMVGWDAYTVLVYCDKRNWKVKSIK